MYLVTNESKYTQTNTEPVPQQISFNRGLQEAIKTPCGNVTSETNKCDGWMESRWDIQGRSKGTSEQWEWSDSWPTSWGGKRRPERRPIYTILTLKIGPKTLNKIRLISAISLLAGILTFGLVSGSTINSVLDHVAKIWICAYRCAICSR